MSTLVTSRELFDNSRFPIVATSIADRPLVQTDLHRHEYFEILFVARGTLKNRVADDEMNLEAGSLVIMKPYVQHLLKDWSVRRDEKAYSCSFLPQAVDSGIQGIEDVEVSSSPNRYYFESMLALADEGVSAVRLAIPKDQAGAVEGLLQRLAEGTEAGTRAAAARVRCDFLALLATLSDIHEGDYSVIEEPVRAVHVAASRHRAGLRRTLAYIHGHISDQITLEEAAEMSGVSVSYFSVLIKQYTGVSFVNYLTSLRMDQACSLLRGSTRSIMDICYEIGFNDYSNFSKRFKKITGMTPRDYRRQSQAGADGE